MLFIPCIVWFIRIPVSEGHWFECTKPIVIWFVAEIRTGYPETTIYSCEKNKSVFQRWTNNSIPHKNLLNHWHWLLRKVNTLRKSRHNLTSFFDSSNKLIIFFFWRNHSQTHSLANTYLIWLEPVFLIIDIINTYTQLVLITSLPWKLLADDIFWKHLRMI